VSTGPVRRARKAALLTRLTQGVACGDKDCFVELYDLTSPYVYGTARQLLQSSRLAMTVTHEVYVEVWRLAPRYDPTESSVLAWMMGLAHRRSTDKVEAMADGSAPGRVADETDNGNHDARPLDGELRPAAERAGRALSALGDPHRQAFVLAYFGECNQGEVTRILGLPGGRVTTRIRPGLVGLRNELGVGR
jgi:RNA polymerase sigma-70 factor, ECF subfamily